MRRLGRLETTRPSAGPWDAYLEHLDTAFAYATQDDHVERWGVSWFHRWTKSRGLPMRKNEPDPPRDILDAYRAFTADVD